MTCLRGVFSEQELHGRWLPAEQLVAYMHMKFQIGDAIKFSLSTMKRVVNKVLPLTGTVANTLEIQDGLQLQVFRHAYQNRTRRDFFWVTTQVGLIPSQPSQLNATAWEQDCVLKRLILGARMHPLSTGTPTTEPDAKRPRVLMDESDLILGDSGAAGGTETSPSSSSPPSWWESGDARKIFAPCAVKYDSMECLRSIVLDRIELLESVNRNGKNWTNVVEPGSWSVETCPYSESDIHTLRLRSMYIALALRQFVCHVTGDMKTQWTWKKCLVFAIECMNDVGIEYYTNFRTLARWHRKLAKHRHFFCLTPEAKLLIPPFFRDNPDALEAFKKHGVAHIQDLCVELMYNFVHQDLLPKLLSKAAMNGLFDDDGTERQDTSDGVCANNNAPTPNLALDINADDCIEITPSTQKDSFLQRYGLKTLGITTIARWMYAVGFRFKKREKHYSVDGHERPETLAYRPVFTRKYLANEVRAHRWIQMTLEESKRMESLEQVPTNCGYIYVNDDGIDMIEYHIDVSYHFEDKLAGCPFGGNLSIRKPIAAKPVIYVGQDEAIFKQFLFSHKMWVAPGGQRALLPKDEGSGTMVSAFVTREHGIIREISNMVLDEVNEQRLGQVYADEEAAIEVHGCSKKMPLTKSKSPFLLFFEYGENREGYWNYNNMVIQFEDAVDVLQVMHPQYDFVFLFDHSSGHAKQRPDGLNHLRMNRSYGGKATHMRTTLIEQEEGYLGSFPRTLEPGDTQSLVFSATDSGPFWLSDAQRDECRHDKQFGTFNDVRLTNTEMKVELGKKDIAEDVTSQRTTRQLRDLCQKHQIPISRLVENVIERNRAELELELRSRGILTKGKNKRELVDLCKANGIECTKTVEKIKEGWMGKAKGLLQVLWERGKIDSTRMKQYSLTGKKDEFGTVVDYSTSLRHLMGLCHDFVNEEGMLQHIAKRLGVEVLLTPKCHAELAGEGVEYIWGGAKGEYRRLSLAEKRGKDNFKASLHHCLSEEVITIDRVRKFARRARQYLMAYHAIDSGQVDTQTLHDCLKFGPVAVDKLIHKVKTHRCAFDFDYKFIMEA